MNILYVTGSCLTRNTSANMSHNGYVKGLLENGHNADIIMAKESWGEEDKALPRWESARYFEYDSVSFADRLRKRVGHTLSAQTVETSSEDKTAVKKQRTSIKATIRSVAKNSFYRIFRPDDIYPLEAKWLQTARTFKGTKKYDVVISNSSPAASHKLVALLTENHSILYDRWIQIWEDPWYFDLYGGHSLDIKKEEHSLLQQAQEICYVSPLTCMYQKEYFPDCADKMRCVPLPFFEFEKSINNTPYPEETAFGYFGDYYSHTRNLMPFYEALMDLGFNGYIYGDTDLSLSATKEIQVSGRVTLDILSGIQANTQILVHLCNLKGGQIPGKIYHYSATNKPILFILDGTEKEQAMIYRFFSKFNRYYFCKNEKNEIEKTMKKIVDENKTFQEVDAFSPKYVVKELLDNE